MLNRIKNDELVRGSLILLIMLGLFNFLNYVFQISMARLLGPEEFSIVAVLMAIIYIFNIPGETIQTIISRHTSKFEAEKSLGKIKNLFVRSLKKGFLLGAGLFLLFIPISFILSKILTIPIWLMILTGLSIFYVFISPIPRGILQGRKEFFRMGGSLVIESTIKVIFTIALVIFGLKSYGAVGGVIIACFVSFLVLFLMVKKILKIKSEEQTFTEIYKKSIPILIAMTCIVVMYSMDIILARAIFPPRLAGQYSFVSLVGKVILFISLAISKSMFPISSQNFDEGKKTSDIFKKSVIIVGGTSLVISAVYFLFPEEIVRIVSLGSMEYVEAAGVLGILATAYTLLSLSNLVLLYKISVNKLKGIYAYIPIIFVLLEFTLMILFNSTITSFSIAFLFANIIMFLYSLWLIKK